MRFVSLHDGEIEFLSKKGSIHPLDGKEKPPQAGYSRRLEMVAATRFDAESLKYSFG